MGWSRDSANCASRTFSRGSYIQGLASARCEDPAWSQVTKGPSDTEPCHCQPHILPADPRSRQDSVPGAIATGNQATVTPPSGCRIRSLGEPSMCEYNPPSPCSHPGKPGPSHDAPSTCIACSGSGFESPWLCQMLGHTRRLMVAVRQPVGQVRNSHPAELVDAAQRPLPAAVADTGGPAARSGVGQATPLWLGALDPAFCYPIGRYAPRGRTGTSGMCLPNAQALSLESTDVVAGWVALSNRHARPPALWRMLHATCDHRAA